MVKGAFRSFVHDHIFEGGPSGTVMTDRLTFESPFGLLGRAFNAVFLTGYLRRLLADRAAVIKAAAEADGLSGHR